MDISLIEEKMEESIKHIYELNSVVRMSLIEMQVRENVVIDIITNVCLYFLSSLGRDLSHHIPQHPP
jgi:hypothetical protein